MFVETSFIVVAAVSRSRMEDDIRLLIYLPQWIEVNVECQDGFYQTQVLNSRKYFVQTEIGNDTRVWRDKAKPLGEASLRALSSQSDTRDNGMNRLPIISCIRFVFPAAVGRSRCSTSDCTRSWRGCTAGSGTVLAPGAPTPRYTSWLVPANCRPRSCKQSKGNQFRGAAYRDGCRSGQMNCRHFAAKCPHISCSVDKCENYAAAICHTHL